MRRRAHSSALQPASFGCEHQQEEAKGCVCVCGRHLFWGEQEAVVKGYENMRQPRSRENLKLKGRKRQTKTFRSWGTRRKARRRGWEVYRYRISLGKNQDREELGDMLHCWEIGKKHGEKLCCWLFVCLVSEEIVARDKFREKSGCRLRIGLMFGWGNTQWGASWSFQA